MISAYDMTGNDVEEMMKAAGLSEVEAAASALESVDAQTQENET